MSKNRSYKATVILDTRGYEEPVDTLLEKIKGILVELGATVSEGKNLGRTDFVRVTDKRHTSDSYLHLEFEGPATVPAALQEKVRLDRTVKRVVVMGA